MISARLSSSIRTLVRTPGAIRWMSWTRSFGNPSISGHPTNHGHGRVLNGKKTRMRMGRVVTMGGYSLRRQVYFEPYLRCVKGIVASSSQRPVLEQAPPLTPTTYPRGFMYSRSFSVNRILASRDDDRENSSVNESSSEDHQDEENDEVMGDLSPEELQELTGGDPKLLKKVKFIQMEHELLRQDGRQVPSVIKYKRWKELLLLDSRTQRQKYFLFLFKTEMKEFGDKRKKALMQQRRSEEFSSLPPRPTHEEDPHSMFYGLNRNAIFLRLYDTRVNSFYHNRVIQAMTLGVPIVIDCGYDDHMTLREAKNCAAQLELLLTNNRQHPEPLDITLCNADPKSKMMQALAIRIPTLYEPVYALNITEKSYTDIFPKNKLVYLSPHAREELTHFDDDEVYIVGAMVDKTDPRPLSLAKSKKEGIRIKKLPLDRYMDWGMGGKSLTINQIGNILLDLRHTQDWEKALRFVPRRKLRQYDDEEDSGPRKPQRRERESEVLTDYELSNRRKGFGGYRNDRNDSYGSTRTGGSKSFEKPKPNMKTIMSDY